MFLSKQKKRLSPLLPLLTIKPKCMSYLLKTLAELRELVKDELSDKKLYELTEFVKGKVYESFQNGLEKKQKKK